MTRPRRRWLIVAGVFSASFAAGMALLVLRSHNWQLRLWSQFVLGTWSGVLLGAFVLNTADLRDALLLGQAMTAALCLIEADYADPDWNTLLGIATVCGMASVPVAIAYALYRVASRPQTECP